MKEAWTREDHCEQEPMERSCRNWKKPRLPPRHSTRSPPNVHPSRSNGEPHQQRQSFQRKEKALQPLPPDGGSHPESWADPQSSLHVVQTWTIRTTPKMNPATTYENLRFQGD